MLFASALSALFDNRLYLLFHLILTHKGVVCVDGLIGALLGAQKAAFYDLPPHHFKGLPVLLIHPKQKTGEHDNDHHHCRSRRPDAAFEQKEKRHSHERRQPKTNKLPLCQIEKYLGFNFRQILWHVYIGHALTPFRKRNIACNFIAPCVPARRFLPGEQLHAG